MNMSAEVRRRAFVIWLRTGRLPEATIDDDVELKHNPWHDPRNGRFTFRGTGRYYGPRGGGGSFGGGGATGSWPAPKSRANPHALARRTPDARRPKPTKPAATEARIERVVTRGAPAAAQPFRKVVRNGYEYQIDATGRTRQVTGSIALNLSQRRSRGNQLRAGGTDRRPSTDHGGHYIARRFNGPTDAFNHFAQDAKFNVGRYLRMEDLWASAKETGKDVFVKIEPSYEGQSQRPSFIHVWFTIDGREDEEHFPNEREDPRHAKR